MKHGRVARAHDARRKKYRRLAVLAGCILDATMHVRVAVAQRAGEIRRPLGQGVSDPFDAW